MGDTESTHRSLYEYFDYRRFLEDRLARRRIDHPHASNRYIAGRLGIDPSYFTKILKGTRTITADLALRIAKQFGLNKKETAYFELLVRYCQAKGHEERKQCFEELLARQSTSATPRLHNHYRYYCEWYYAVVRELLNCTPLRDDYEAIAQMVIPSITPNQAARALRALEEMELIRRGEEGAWEPTDRFITPGPDIAAVAIRSFQMAMMDLAKEALERFPREDREVSTLTVSLSAEGYRRVRERMREMRREIMTIVAADRGDAGVYQINLQAFPAALVNRRKA